MYYILIGVIGAAFGSFFNVCISRMPRKKSIVFPASRCPQCNYKIKPSENIPILSYILLRGKCKNCGVNIHWHYPLVEFLTPLLFILLYAKLGFSLIFLKYLVFVSFCLIMFFIDLFHKIIPDRLSLPLLILGSIFAAIGGFDVGIYAALIGGGFGFLVFLITAYAFQKITKKESLGGGDIKLIAATGVFLGIFGTIFTIVIGSMLAMFTLIILRHDRSKEFPFGPFLILAAFIYLFLGDLLFSWYFAIV